MVHTYGVYLSDSKGLWVEDMLGDPGCANAKHSPVKKHLAISLCIFSSVSYAECVEWVNDWMLPYLSAGERIKIKSPSDRDLFEWIGSELQR